MSSSNGEIHIFRSKFSGKVELHLHGVVIRTKLPWGEEVETKLNDGKSVDTECEFENILYHMADMIGLFPEEVKEGTTFTCGRCDKFPCVCVTTTKEVEDNAENR